MIKNLFYEIIIELGLVGGYLIKNKSFLLILSILTFAQS